MAAYPPALLDEIRTSVDIVELVGRFVNLRKAGVNWKGLCPFHSEKTPSFMVNPKKGIFHCFGCGVGGDAFGFLMRQDRLSFPEAVRSLARSAGIALPEERGRTEDSGREELYRVMDLAARFYAECLNKPMGEQARRYLEQRGVDLELARRFGLGFAPDAWDSLLGFMRGEQVSPAILETVGLVLARQSGGGFYDRFRGRLMFAIRDQQGRVVAFGGRAFGDEQPKYLNSPETPIYVKGNLLYAIDLARGPIRERNRALLVEGYVDCLMAHQHGFTETVAALGTAFTSAQLGILRRYCEEVVTFFDADAAGQKAAERAAELLEPGPDGLAWSVNRTGAFEGGAFRLKAALLPPGHDPDTYLRAEGAGAFSALIAGSRSLLGYALDRALADPDGASGPRARANAFARAALMLAKVTDADEAATLSREAASKLGVDPTQLWIEAQRLQAALRRPTATTRPPTRPAGVRAEDRALVRLLLLHPEARPVLLPVLGPDDLGSPSLRAIVAALTACPTVPAESLMTDLDDDARGLLAALLVEEDDRNASDPQASIGDFRRRLELGQRLRRIREVSRSIAEAQTADAAQAPLLEQLRTLDREGKEVRATTLGVVQTQHLGPAGPQGVQTHE